MKAYASISAIAVLGSLLMCWQSEQQYFAAMRMMVTEKLYFVSLVNFACVAVVALVKGVVAFFLGELRLIETEKARDSAVVKMVDVMLALAILNLSLSVYTFASCVFLLGMRYLFVVSRERLDRVGREDSQSLLLCARALAFAVLLLFCNVIVVLNADSGSLVSLSNYVTFECAIIVVEQVASLAHFFVLFVDTRRYNHRWSRRPQLQFFVDICAHSCSLLLYAAFFVVLSMTTRTPLFLLREVLAAIGKVLARVSQYVSYRRLMRNIDSALPDATPEQLEQAHGICIICRDDMDHGKTLPCGHIMHLDPCLRTWLEQHSRCPVCRADIGVALNTRNQNNANVRQNNNNVGNNNNNVENVNAENINANAPAADANVQNQRREEQRPVTEGVHGTAEDLLSDEWFRKTITEYRQQQQQQQQQQQERERERERERQQLSVSDLSARVEQPLSRFDLPDVVLDDSAASNRFRRNVLKLHRRYVAQYLDELEALERSLASPPASSAETPVAAASITTPAPDTARHESIRLPSSSREDERGDTFLRLSDESEEAAPSSLPQPASDSDDGLSEGASARDVE
ncbi:MAG: hypothetical protein MHM6MM_000855 [Cercozoa sp. M6MM]